MHLRFLPFASSAVGVGGRSFPVARSPPVRECRARLFYNVNNYSPSDKEGDEAKREPGLTEDTLRRLAELDAQLEGLSQPKERPPAPPPPPDPYMDRDVIMGRGTTDDLPDITPTYVAFSTLALVFLTIFTNVMFNLYIKPSVDGVEQPVKTQRVPLVNPADQQF